MAEPPKKKSDPEGAPQPAGADKPARQIVPDLRGEAREIFDWLESLFNISARDTAPGKVKTEPDSFPERISLHAVYGRTGENYAPAICGESWKPGVSDPPSRERLAELANYFYGRAQKDASTLRKMQRYGLYAFSNIKGPRHYDRHLFLAMPGGREMTEEEARALPAADDEDTHRDRFLGQMMAHQRWQHEQFTEAMSGVMKLQQSIIAQQQNTITQMEADRRADRLAAEEALSKKQERELAAEWAKAKITMLGDMWGSLKGYLPAAATYLTKGKVGIVEGLKEFLGGLTEDTRIALLGDWDQNDNCTKPGVLDETQVKMLSGIIAGDIPPTEISEFIIGLRPDQLAAANNILTPQQIQQLGALVKAAGDVKASNQAKAS